MSLHTVSDVSEAAVLEATLGLYLKPVSRIKINVQLPKLSLPGQSISSWHVMEKLKATVKPDTFLCLKALKITSTVIKFEGELETKASCERALARLRATGSLKLSGFTEKLQIRAAHSTASGPTRHDWEAFFRDAKGVNEMKPGERPDTIHLQEVPLRWFAEGSKNLNPNEKLLRMAFGTFGKIRRLEVPPRVESGSISTIGKTSSLHSDLLFEVYIQYEEYVEFAIAMDSLRGKKLLYKEPNGKVYSADIKVDFDRTKYLSEACIKKREAEEKKLNPISTVEKEKISTKDNSHSTSQTKQQDTQVSKKQVSPTQQLALNTQVLLDKDSRSNEKAKDANEVFGDQKRAQLEAKLLLIELLRKAEKTERHKDQVEKLDVSQKRLESQKRPKKSTSSERSHKKIKILGEKTGKELEVHKTKCSERKFILQDEGDKACKVEKWPLSEEKEAKKRFEKAYEEKRHNKKRIKNERENKDKTSMHVEDKYKEKHIPKYYDETSKAKLSTYTESKYKERKSPVQYNEKKKERKKHIDNKYKERKRQAHYDETNKEKSPRISDKCKEKMTSMHYDKLNKEKTSHIDDKYKEKTLHIDDKYKERKTSVHCDEMNKGKNANFDDLSMDYQTTKNEKKNKEQKIEESKEKHKQTCPEKSKEKIRNTEKESLVLNEKEEEIQMYIEEKKLKERLIQAYNQKKRNKQKLIEQERILKEKLLKNLRAREEQKLKVREELRKELSGRKVLKSVLADTNHSLYKKN